MGYDAFGMSNMEVQRENQSTITGYFFKHFKFFLSASGLVAEQVHTGNHIFG